MKTVFYKDKEEYTNSLNPAKEYLQQLSLYIATTRGVSEDKAKVVAKKILQEKFKDRPITYFERNDVGDREVKHGGVYSYIKENLSRGNVLVPTFTSYMASKEKKSMLSEFVIINVKDRSVAKKAAQKAKVEGNMDLYISKNNEQAGKKIDNNSLSGVVSQKGFPGYNPTAHNTLTSITRIITSLSNANNERLLQGNRYLPEPKSIMVHLVYLVSRIDTSEVKTVVDKYGLYLPSVEDTVKVLKRSSELYGNCDDYYRKKVIPYLEKLDAYQLAGICYSGDLYHIRVFNSDFVKEVISKLLVKVESSEVMSDVGKLYSKDEALLYYSHNIFYESLKGVGKDYSKINDGRAASIYSTIENIERTLLEYKDFFNVFFMKDIFPPNSFRLKHMKRRTVVLSDTDSTCFTMDEWVTWYKGEFVIEEETIALAGLLSYIASQVIINLLAILSKNMNVDKEHLHTLAMKNEFLWLVHVPAEISKHYFALTAIQEGNIFKDLELEVKGVHLKNSAVPSSIIEDTKRLQVEILTSVTKNKKIKLRDILLRVIKVEDDITKSIMNGESVYYKRSKVKDKDSYSLDETRSPYKYHDFWMSVFEPKYGMAGDLPYTAIKIPTILEKGKDIADWLEVIEDKAIKDRLVSWFSKTNRNSFPTIHMSDLQASSRGVPTEILPIINIKGIILDVTKQYRIIIETLGVILDEDLTIKEQFDRI